MPISNGIVKPDDAAFPTVRVVFRDSAGRYSHPKAEPSSPPQGGVALYKRDRQMTFL